MLATNSKSPNFLDFYLRRIIWSTQLDILFIEITFSNKDFLEKPNKKTYLSKTNFNLIVWVLRKSGDNPIHPSHVKCNHNPMVATQYHFGQLGMLDGSIIFGMCPIYDNRDNQIKNHYMLRYESVITECGFNYFTTYIENKLLNFYKFYTFILRAPYTGCEVVLRLMTLGPINLLWINFL